MEKLILDACCGSKKCWFDKNHPNTVYADIRDEEYILCDDRKLVVHPDVVQDFTNMQFEDNSFKLVLFDPPHLHTLGQNTWLAATYGTLLPTWEQDINKGFNECMRVLEPYGTLIFKWSTVQVKLSKILEVIGQKPLFGHTSGKAGNTIWLVFMKIPS